MLRTSRQCSKNELFAGHQLEALEGRDQINRLKKTEQKS